MTTVLQDSLGDILDNYADAIEGGNSYRGSGTAYKGFPGTRGYHDREAETVTATDGSTTTIVCTNSSGSDFVRSDGPPFFMRCLTQAALTGNVGAARKITAWDGTNTFTVAPAFSDSVAATDTFQVEEGFKRAPDNWDPFEEDGPMLGFDRVFKLEAGPGVQLPWYGSGVSQYETVLTITTRILAKTRSQNAKASLLENVGRMRVVLVRSELRDGTHTQLLSAIGGTPPSWEMDNGKVVAKDQYKLIYRVHTTYL